VSHFNDTYAKRVDLEQRQALKPNPDYGPQLFLCTTVLELGAARFSSCFEPFPALISLREYLPDFELKNSYNNRFERVA
jgi:hypothetical protein